MNSITIVVLLILGLGLIFFGIADITKIVHFRRGMSNEKKPIKPLVNILDSGEILIEWIAKDMRFNLSLERDPRDSCWVFVSRYGLSECGVLPKELLQLQENSLKLKDANILLSKVMSSAEVLPINLVSEISEFFGKK